MASPQKPVKQMLGVHDSILPFFMLEVDFGGWDKCCALKEEATHLDHAGDFHAFSLTRLAWAIQHKADAECIERYLNKFNPVLVKTDLNGTVKGRMVMDMFPILFFAVERNSPEIVRVLCKAGADPGKRVYPAGLPILPYTVLISKYDLSDTTDTMLALLASGADPDQVPIDMWEAPLKTPQGDHPRIAEIGKPNVYTWCTNDVRKALARDLNLMQRYCLWRSKHFVPPTARMKQIAEAFSILPLLETYHHIIGQTPAIKQVIDALASHYLFDSGFPLIFLFTGASGHGKTELAKRMGNLLALDIHITDCTEMKHETDIFGPKAPFQGWQQGSSLNGFLAQNSGKRAVVFMDEFEKTTADVHKALLLPFESGAYVDRRNQKKIDSSKIIWILAANLGEEVIQRFWSAYIKDNPEEDLTLDKIEKLSALLDRVVMKSFGPPLTGRFSYTVPFLPFNQLEQAVTTYKFMREFKNEIREPVDVGARLFPRRLILDYMEDGQLAQHLAQRGYVHELGARSLQKVVHRHIKQKLAHVFLLDEAKIYDEMNQEPMAAYEVRLASANVTEQEVVLERKGVRDIQQRKEEQL